jgi:hypothetical protein
VATQIGRLVSREYSDQIFSVHPLAEEAYSRSKQLKRQYNLDLLTVETVQNFQAVHPLIVIKSPKPENKKAPVQYLFYSNWVWLDLIKHLSIPNLHILEIDESDAGDISTLAWSYVASEELLAINRKENFCELEVLLQRITDKSGNNLIFGGSKKVTVKTMEQLSGETRGVIRGQQRKNTVEISGLEKFIFEDSGRSL